MPVIALKIDVDTYRGTQVGVPNLVRLLQQHRARASFLFSLGPDHTGWALRRVFRPGFFQKVARTSVVAHYGLKTLMYGVLLPAPDIGRRCAKEMRAVRDAGFECGIHTWDHVVWQDHVRHRDDAWTRKHMQRAFDRFVAIFGVAPGTHGAAGWQMNPSALSQLDAFKMRYASDGRAALTQDGALVDAAAGPHRLIGSDCIQLPTTLPTLDELLGRSVNGIGMTPSTIAAAMLQLTATPRDHVFTLHAELEGQKLIPVFEQLIRGWQEQGYDLVALADYYQRIDPRTVPVHPIAWGSVPGRAGELILDKPVRHAFGY